MSDLDEEEFESTGAIIAGTPQFEAAVAITKDLLRIYEALADSKVETASLAASLYMLLATLSSKWAVAGNEERWIDSIAHGAKMVLRQSKAHARRPKN